MSIDVFLDETTKGLKGNLALAVAGPEIGDIGADAGPSHCSHLGYRRLLPRALSYPVRVALEDG